ncbi:MAG TPA: universal stress protein [Solirubrobacter sp.]|nr:universal stress protein [Solirubrobacter sp.]
MSASHDNADPAHDARRPPGDDVLPPALRDGRPVICAVDDDDLAPTVLATAAMLARRLGVPLTVVHSPYPDVYVTGEPHRQALERGYAFIDRLSESHPVDQRVVEADDPARLIMALAREGASMIVLGTRGRTGLRAAILGSVSHAVLADAQCPVVTVSALAAPAVETPERAAAVAP